MCAETHTVWACATFPFEKRYEMLSWKSITSGCLVHVIILLLLWSKRITVTVLVGTEPCKKPIHSLCLFFRRMTNLLSVACFCSLAGCYESFWKPNRGQDGSLTKPKGCLRTLPNACNMDPVSFPWTWFLSLSVWSCWEKKYYVSWSKD